MDVIENIFKSMDDDYKNIHEDDYKYIYDDEIFYKCKRLYYKYIFCPTLKQLFDKYEYNIEMINYETINDLGNPIKRKNYIIDFRGDTIGEIIINYSNSYSVETDIDAWVGSIRDYPLDQLLCLIVNIPSWNKYSNKYFPP